MRRTRRSQQFWEHAVAEQERSGQSLQEFAVERGLNVATFQRWHGRLTRPESRSPPKADEPRLLRVDVKKTRPARAEATRPAGTVRVHVGAARLQFAAGTDVQYIAQLMRALEAAC